MTTGTNTVNDTEAKGTYSVGMPDWFDRPSKSNPPWWYTLGSTIVGKKR